MLTRLWRPRHRTVPLEIQLEAACAAASVNYGHKVRKLLAPFGYPDALFVSSSRLKQFFTFSPLQLLEYLQRHPRRCREMLYDCEDKRFSPSTFVSRTARNRYLVGMFDPEKGETEVQEFRTMAQAITDYVLYSLRLGRFKGT